MYLPTLFLTPLACSLPPPQLEAIEAAFLSERDELLNNNKGEIDSLFEKRRANEQAFMQAKQQREEKYQQEISDLLVKDTEEYNKLKIKLEVRNKKPIGAAPVHPHHRRASRPILNVPFPLRLPLVAD